MDPRSKSLNGRLVFVTGAARGIGKALALAFAAEGARLAITARSEPELREVAAQVKHLGTETLVLPGDLAERSIPGSLVQHAEAALGPVDILINNAALVSAYSPKPVADFD